MSLRKFPVTAPDGTEFRVTIREVKSEYFDDYVSVKLYVKRRRWGFRKVYQRNYTDGSGVYAQRNPEYIAITRRLVNDYYEFLHADAEYQRMINRTEARRKAAATRFAEWDGRLTK